MLCLRHVSRSQPTGIFIMIQLYSPALSRTKATLRGIYIHTLITTGRLSYPSRRPNLSSMNCVFLSSTRRQTRMCPLAACTPTGVPSRHVHHCKRDEGPGLREWFDLNAGADRHSAALFGTQRPGCHTREHLVTNPLTILLPKKKILHMSSTEI